MVDLEFLQDRTGERSAPRADGIDFVERGESAKNSDERQVPSDELAGDTPAARENT